MTRYTRLDYRYCRMHLLQIIKNSFLPLFLQYFFGVAAFVFLKDKLGASKTLRWWHSFCGYLTFFAGIETCVVSEDPSRCEEISLSICSA